MNDWFSNDFDEHVLPPIHIALLLLVTFFFLMIFGTLVLLLVGSPWAMLSEIFIILPAIFYVYYRKLPWIKVFRFHSISWKNLVLAFVISVATIVVTDEVDRLISLVFPMPDILVKTMQDLVQVNSLTDGIVLFLSAVVMAALAEEMLFRGMLQNSFEYFIDPAMAIVISAIIFALIHFNPWSAIQFTMMGIVLGYMTWVTNSIWPAIILHGTNNLLSLVMVNIPEQNLAWYSSGHHVKLPWIIVALVIGGFAFYQLHQQNNPGQAENPEMDE
ncbi:CPBP family intramembrane metalloprotease [candidate division KSB1 bacterium]|jgi:membrane protease YdiL (CAAX protease family)|nr:CPBP family intramembrane metalloprotease [candidate division KSB1 bacterium]